MSGYVTHAIEKIENLRNEFEECMFCVIMDTTTASECMFYFQSKDIDIKIYESKGTSKVTLFLRYLPIFIQKYENYDVAIIDVHDELKTQVIWIRKALCQLSRLNKDVFFMYIHSTDKECPYPLKLHNTCHTHRDAGFSVWKCKGKARSKIIKENLFDEFFTNLQTFYKSYAYGADEVLMDSFLSKHISKEEQILKKNVFMSCKCSYTPLKKMTWNQHLPIDGKIHFSGDNDMYVCNRVDHL